MRPISRYDRDETALLDVRLLRLLHSATTIIALRRHDEVLLIDLI